MVQLVENGTALRNKFQADRQRTCTRLDCKRSHLCPGHCKTRAESFQRMHRRGSLPKHSSSNLRRRLRLRYPSNHSIPRRHTRHTRARIPIHARREVQMKDDGQFSVVQLNKNKSRVSPRVEKTYSIGIDIRNLHRYLPEKALVTPTADNGIACNRNEGSNDRQESAWTTRQNTYFSPQLTPCCIHQRYQPSALQ